MTPSVFVLKAPCTYSIPIETAVTDKWVLCSADCDVGLVCGTTNTCVVGQSTGSLCSSTGQTSCLTLSFKWERMHGTEGRGKEMGEGVGGRWGGWGSIQIFMPISSSQC